MVKRRRWRTTIYSLGRQVPASHHATPPAALRPLIGLRAAGHEANFLEGELEELARDGGALHVPVHPYLLGDPVALLWVDDAVGVLLGPQVSLEAQHGEGQRALGREGRTDFLDPLQITHCWFILVDSRLQDWVSEEWELVMGGVLGGGGKGKRERERERERKQKGVTNDVLEVDEAQALADVVAQEDEIRPEETPALGARRVVEFQSIAFLPKGDLEDEGLIYVAEQRDGLR